MRITHPFHPLAGQEFDVVCRRQHWGEDRVTYIDLNGALRSVSAGLTDVDPPDQFRRTAGNTASFRTVDLVELCDLLERHRSRSGADGV